MSKAISSELSNMKNHYEQLRGALNTCFQSLDCLKKSSQMISKAISDFDHISSQEYEETGQLKTVFSKFEKYVSGWDANIKKMISKSKKFEENFRFSGAEFDVFQEVLDKRKSVSRILMHETIHLNSQKKQLFNKGYSKEEWKIDEKKIEKYKEDLKDSAKAAEMAKPVPNKSYTAVQRMPVYIVYFTCGVNVNGGIEYYNDGYKRDDKLIQFMNKPRKTKTVPKPDDMKKATPESFNP